MPVEEHSDFYMTLVDLDTFLNNWDKDRSIHLMFEKMIAISWCLICLGTCYLKELVKFAFFHWRVILPFRHISNICLTVIEK